MKNKITLPEGFDPEKRAAQAKENFLNGYNCCQAVLLAYTDIIGLDREVAATIASGFGGGMGRLREVCGAVTGMSMVAGFILPAADPSIKEERTANYALVQKFAGAYRAENGSIVCKELLGLVPHSCVDKNGIGKPCDEILKQNGSGMHGVNLKQESPEPSDRTPEYYRKRPCPELVASAARIIAEELLSLSAGA